MTDLQKGKKHTMWTIGEIKGKGRAVMHSSYWKMVLVGFILVLAAGSAAATSAAATASANMSADGSTVTYTFSNKEVVMASVMAILGTVAMLSGLAELAIRLFLLHPLEAGCRRFQAVAHVEGNAASLTNIFYCFPNGYLNVVKTMLLRDLFTFLWSLLFVIPGIVKGYSYRLIPYILAEEPNMTSDEAFRLSREMMRGNKWHAFLFDMSFIGWDFLNALTLGILGLFYVNPYRESAKEELYITIRDQYMGTRS